MTFKQTSLKFISLAAALSMTAIAPAAIAEERGGDYWYEIDLPVTIPGVNPGTTSGDFRESTPAVSPAPSRWLSYPGVSYNNNESATLAPTNRPPLPSSRYSRPEYRLTHVPARWTASINSVTGVISYRPADFNAPGFYRLEVTVRRWDKAGAPSESRSIWVHVNEVNDWPLPVDPTPTPAPSPTTKPVPTTAPAPNPTIPTRPGRWYWSPDWLGSMFSKLFGWR